MAESIRLKTLKERYTQYIDAEAAILAGAQEYTLGKSKITRANLKDIQCQIKYLESQIDKQTQIDAGKGARKVWGVVPRDI